MKLYLVIVYVLIITTGFAQTTPRLSLTKEGIKPISIKFDSLTSDQLYSKAIKWVHFYYKAHSPAITGVENKMITVDAIKSKVWVDEKRGNLTYYDVEYSFVLEFADHEIRIGVALNQTYYTSVKGGKGLVFIDYTKLWSKKGKLHKMYKNTKPGIDQMMNGLSASLVNYLNQ